MEKYTYTDIGNWRRDEMEPEGSKEKRWVINPADETRWLFKIGRNHTENWAEIVAAAICRKLQIPHAEYCMAKRDNALGTISKSFLRHETISTKLELEFAPAFNFIQEIYGEPYDKIRGQIRYTPDVVVRLSLNPCAFQPLRTPDKMQEHSPLFFLFGYLVLDALIGNSDRHHQNWGFCRRSGDSAEQESRLDELYLAPTFDHGSAFCKEPPETQEKRLLTNDEGYKIRAWCEKGRSRFYGNNGKKLTMLEVVEEISSHIRALTAYAENPPSDLGGIIPFWRREVESFSPEQDAAPVLDGFGHDIMPPDCKKFALEMLEINRTRILGVLNKQ